MQNIITEIMVNIAIFFVTGVIIVVGNAIRKWLEAKMLDTSDHNKNAIYGMLYDIVRFVVQGIEQMYISGDEMTSEEKKRKAVDQVKDWVDKMGYTAYITPKLIDSVIEACVKEMNDQLPPEGDEITPEF